MHDEKDLREIARRSGAKVLEVRRVRSQIAGAGDVVIARMSVPSSQVSFVVLQNLAVADAGDPIVRDLAWAIRQQAGTDPEALARAVHTWVKNCIAYEEESRETFEGAAYTISAGRGDCDSHARVVCALAKAAGLPARIAPLYMNAKSKEVVHAYCQIQVNGEWYAAETTLPTPGADFGEEPRAAAKRLGSRRADILSNDVVGA